jgi:hypothetical protein
MSDKTQEQPQPQLEIPVEMILDLDDQLKDEMKRIILKAFHEEIPLNRMCETIKMKLQEKEEGKWNVIIGKDFSTFVVHKSRRYGLFKVGELNILIWQSGSTTL